LEENNENILYVPWGAVCKEYEEFFNIKADSGDTLTHIGRKVVKSYLTAVSIFNIGKTALAFSQAQLVYAEDAVKDYLLIKNISVVGSIQVPCEVVEVAFVVSPGLTLEEFKNLEAYASSFFELDERRWLLEAIKKAVENSKKNTEEKQTQPYIIGI
jgi:hypothetical protein